MRTILKAILFLLILLSGAVARGPITRLRAEAKMGIAAAQNALGEKYYRGQGVPKDYFEAENWFHKAAEQGYAKARLSLGRLYDPDGHYIHVGEFRSIVEKSQQYAIKAEKWYRMAAQQGLADAQYELAWLYMRGWGNHPQDYNEETEKWLIEASERGHTVAQFNLGHYYYFGPEVDKHKVRAYMWLALSASNGYQRAVKMRDLVAKNMTSTEIEKAKKLARRWRPKKSR